MALPDQLSVAQGLWERVGVYQMTEVPTSIWGNDCVETMPEQFSEQPHWMSCNTAFITTKLAQLSLECIVRIHSVQHEIVRFIVTALCTNLRSGYDYSGADWVAHVNGITHRECWAVRDFQYAGQQVSTDSVLSTSQFVWEKFYQWKTMQTTG